MRIIKTVDVGLVKVNGEEWLYNTIKAAKKPTFEDDERLLFYLHDADSATFVSSSGDLERLLDKFLDMLDVPAYFVIKDFSGGIKLVPEEDTKCVYPWMHFYAGPLGDIKPCCIASGDFGNVSEFGSFDEIINSTKLKELRKSMLKGHWTDSCKVCRDSERSSGISYRTKSNESFAEHMALLEDTRTDGSIDNFRMRFFDIRLSNLCNFKCRTCSHEFSSSIAAEEGIISPLFRSKFKEQYKKLLAEVVEHINSIDSFYFAGGEPLLMAEHYNILDALISHGRQKIVKLEYNSNFSTLTYKGKHISEWWNQFDHVYVGLSLDDDLKRAELLRNGTKWDTIMQNILSIEESSPHVTLKIKSTYSTYNCLTLPDFHRRMIEDFGFIAHNITVNPAVGDMNDLQILPKQIKAEVTAKVDDFCTWAAKFPYTEDLVERYKICTSLMNSEDRSYLWEMFLQRSANIDRMREENTPLLYPHVSY